MELNADKAITVDTEHSNYKFLQTILVFSYSNTRVNLYSLYDWIRYSASKKGQITKYTVLIPPLY